MNSIETVTELERAITAFSEGRKEDARKSIERLFLDEVEIDELRRSVFVELTKGSLPQKYREDLKDLVKHLDVMADHVKDSARSIKILLDADAKVPKEILDSLVRTSRTLVECATALRETIETLGVDPYRVRELAAKVESIEGHIDDEYLKTKSLFIKHADNVNAAILMVLRDLSEFMEQTADVCADTADHLRILAAGEERP